MKCQCCNREKGLDNTDLVCVAQSSRQAVMHPPTPGIKPREGGCYLSLPSLLQCCCSSSAIQCCGSSGKFQCCCSGARSLYSSSTNGMLWSEITIQTALANDWKYLPVHGLVSLGSRTCKEAPMQVVSRIALIALVLHLQLALEP